MVGSDLFSNSSETIWLSLLSAKTKNIRSKMKALECSQHYTLFFRPSRVDNSSVDYGFLPKFELLQSFMHVLITGKNEDDSTKNEGARVDTTFSHYKSVFFPEAQGQLTPQSFFRSDQIWNSFKTSWLS